VIPERALDRCPAAKPGSGRWDCRPVKSHALVVVYISRQNRGLAATLGVENGRLGKSGADAVVRARPPGRTLALIVNSYAGQVTSARRPLAERRQASCWRELSSKRNRRSSPAAVAGSESRAPVLSEASTRHPQRSTKRTRPGGENTQ
jgi:hypothetical protein